MKTIAVVPIKLNNERLPGKNTKLLGGIPLIQHILNTLLQVNYIDDIYVYCSNPSIKEYLPIGVKYLQRSEALDLNTAKINEVLSAFAKETHADIYVLAHATAPFVKAESIAKGVLAVKSRVYDSAFAAKKMQTFFWKGGVPLNYQLDNIPRTQDLEPIFEETSGFYVYTSEVINDFNRRIGTKPLIVEVSNIEGIDIDNAEDFSIANAIFSNLLNNKSNGTD